MEKHNLWRVLLFCLLFILKGLLISDESKVGTISFRFVHAVFSYRNGQNWVQTQRQNTWITIKCVSFEVFAPEENKNCRDNFSKACNLCLCVSLMLITFLCLC